MSEQPQSSQRNPASSRERLDIGAAFAAQPASFWLASLASIGLIAGGLGPWATAFGFLSLSGTSMHGWRAVAAGIVGLVMVGLHQRRRGRLPLVVAGAAGAFGALQAMTTLGKISTGGAVVVLGQQYRYLDAAWGLYLVLAGGIALLLAASALAWRASRAAR